MNLFFPHGNRVLQSPMHALAAEQSDAEAEERAGLRPWRMGAVGCMAAKAPGRARRKGSNGRDGLASCMATHPEDRGANIVLFEFYDEEEMADQGEDYGPPAGPSCEEL